MLSPRSSAALRANRAATARQALTVCADADALAAEALADGFDDHRLFALLETREQMLQDLAEHLAVLQQTSPTADNPLFAATERAVDDADALIALLCEALATSERATMELATRVARRVEEIRDELDEVRRASSASFAYQAGASAMAVDLRR